MVIASQKLQNYFVSLEKETERALKIAQAARSKGYDPEDHVDIPLAKNMAEKVIGLISAVAPQLNKSDIVERIVELEKEFSPLDWRVGFKIAEEVAKEKFCKFESKKEAVEVGIRTGFTYLTGGIVSAPLEGFVEIRIKKRADGGEYVACVYAGPIRGAGGTAAATSVVLADYVATKMGYAKYDPTEAEVSRIVGEVSDYHERITNLQYFPSEEEIKFMVRHLPVEVDGEPTERIEVLSHKDLPRIDTNLIRGGVCLVICEGLCQKIPKIWKRLSVWGKGFGIDWSFLEDFLKLQKDVKSKGKKQEQTKGISPNYTYIKDLVAGRPILTHPMGFGGFRLRLGRTRISGFSALALSPATLKVLKDYIVYGTQLKIERPGKAGSVTICDCIEGPIALLENGEVKRIGVDSREDIKKIKKILFLGDILINYGDFSENGHPLVALGYCEEWWQENLEKKIVETYGSITVDNISRITGVDIGVLSNLFTNIFSVNPTYQEAFALSEKLNIPLHPQYLFYYSGLSVEDFSYMLEIIHKSKINYLDDALSKIKTIAIIYDDKIKNCLELIGTPHFIMADYIIVTGDDAMALANATGIFRKEIQDLEYRKKILESNKDKSVLELINLFSSSVIMDKSGTFVGARMGRPEKAKMRKLQGSPQVLFPVGEEGGRLRSFQSSMDAGEVTSDFPLYFCEVCKKRTIFRVCHICNSSAKKLYFCSACNKDLMTQTCETHKDTKTKKYRKVTISIKEYVDSCLSMMKTKVYPDLIKGVKGTSNKDHVPEHLVKGFLRAKHDIYVNKDGTTRYDMSECPITAFKPKEIGTSIEKLKEMGYTTDIDGKDIISDDQVVEIFPQDIILPGGEGMTEEQADDIIMRTGNFIDDLLKILYKEKKFHNFKVKSDIIGSLIVCLAPHISCGTIGRVIGFSRNQVMLAHPMMHAALRRDCDGDEACFILLMDAFLNFSRQYLPDRRGSRTMDAPLVLSSMIVPSEIDDQVHGVDVVKRYPLELYEAALNYKMPWEVKIEQLKHRIGTEGQYEHFYSTHPVDDINYGNKVSAYKVLPSMQEKLEGQMILADLIRAVDASSVATMVIQQHFLKDIKGNLRKFTQQQFRCSKCNDKFVRPPLIGKCPACGGKIIFTISEGSVIKYLGPSINLAEKFGVSAYLKQTLDLTQQRVDSFFGKDKEIQQGLGNFF